MPERSRYIITGIYTGVGAGVSLYLEQKKCKNRRTLDRVWEKKTSKHVILMCVGYVPLERVIVES